MDRRRLAGITLAPRAPFDELREKRLIELVEIKRAQRMPARAPAVHIGLRLAA